MIESSLIAVEKSLGQQTHIRREAAALPSPNARLDLARARGLAISVNDYNFV
jgi:hypothetical protein